MRKGSSEQSITHVSPKLEGFEIKGRPLTGLGLLIASVVGTFAVLIYFGAWAVSDRMEKRVAATESSVAHIEVKWREDSLLTVCPLH